MLQKAKEWTFPPSIVLSQYLSISEFKRLGDPFELLQLGNFGFHTRTDSSSKVTLNFKV